MKLYKKHSLHKTDLLNEP